MTSSERKALWTDRIRSWKASGLSADAYARGKGFSGQALRYWALRLGLLHDPPASPKPRSPKSSPPRASSRSPRFVQVVQPKTCSDELLLELGAVRLRVRHGFDPALLRAVVLSLSEKP